MPKVSIIILNWNGWKNTLECLESLYQITYPNYEVIVVDNASDDQSVEKIKKWTSKKLDKKLFILENDKNYGFAGGNNIAINQILKDGKSDYILLLNNDTVVDKKFLSELIKVAESSKNIGIVGPKIYYYNFHYGKNVIQSVGTKVNLYTGRFSNYGDKQIDRKQFENIKTVDSVCGACLLIKNEVINKIGLLDEKFFTYFEDVDWCLRAKKREYDIVCVSSSFIWHKRGESLAKMPALSMYYHAKNLFLIEKKHASFLQFLFFLCYYFLARFPKKMIYCLLQNNKLKVMRYYLRGLWEGLFS